MSEQDIIQYLSSRRFTVLWSGGKDSTATLLWVLDNIQHEDFNILYLEVTGNTHELSNAYVYDLVDELGLKHKFIHAKREDLDFFEALRRWKIPLIGKYRWCMYQFKIKLIQKHACNITVSGIRRSDSIRRRNIKVIEFMRLSERINVNPIADWSKKQVIHYIMEHEIDINPCYSICGHSGNCMFCPYHTTSNIIRTLAIPEWRNKIINTLKALPYKRMSEHQKRIYDKWMRYDGQKLISHFSEKSGDK